MRMKRKILLMFLSVLLCTLCASSLAAKTEGDFEGFHWKLEKSTLVVTGSGTFSSGPWDSYHDKITILDISGNNITVDTIISSKLKTIHLGKGVKHVTGNFGIGAVKKPPKIVIDDNDFEWNSGILDNAMFSEVEFGEEVDNFVVEDGFVLNNLDSRAIITWFQHKESEG